MDHVLKLSLELFAGSHISDVCKHLCKVSSRVGVLCEVKFNGVIIWAKPGDDPALLIESFHRVLAEDSKYKRAEVR